MRKELFCERRLFPGISTLVGPRICVPLKLHFHSDGGPVGYIGEQRSWLRL
jgi:hypothetical protein